MFEEMNGIVKQLKAKGDSADPEQDGHISGSLAGNRCPHGDRTLRRMINSLLLSVTDRDLDLRPICYGADGRDGHSTTSSDGGQANE